MKQFKVESVTIKKEYKTVVIEAANRSEALEKARTLKKEDFDLHEVSDQSEWDAKSDRGFFNMLLALFEGKS